MPSITTLPKNTFHLLLSLYNENIYDQSSYSNRNIFPFFDFPVCNFQPLTPPFSDNPPGVHLRVGLDHKKGGKSMNIIHNKNIHIAPDGWIIFSPSLVIMYFMLHN